MDRSGLFGSQRFELASHALKFTSVLIDRGNALFELPAEIGLDRNKQIRPRLDRPHR